MPRGGIASSLNRHLVGRALRADAELAAESQEER
jgi:hypothetical protein